MSATGFQQKRRNILKSKQDNPALKPSYAEKDWQELKKIATEKGIEVKGKKKLEILKALAELEDGQNDNNTGEGKNGFADNNGGKGLADQ